MSFVPCFRVQYRPSVYLTWRAVDGGERFDSKSSAQTHLSLTIADAKRDAQRRGDVAILPEYRIIELQAHENGRVQMIGVHTEPEPSRRTAWDRLLGDDE